MTTAAEKMGGKKHGRARRCAFSPGDVVAVNDPRTRNLYLIVAVRPTTSLPDVLTADLLMLGSGSATIRFITGTYGFTAMRWILSGRRIRTKAADAA